MHAGAEFGGLIGATSGRRPTILVVDDQPANIHALARIIADDADAVFALDGGQALERVRRQQIDLVLLDVSMPGLDGYDVCRRLKSEPDTAPIPVIFVSGLTESADEEQGFAVGAVDYIHKPFLPAVVRARVRTQLALRAALARLEALSRTDALTGLANRRHFDLRFAAELKAARNRGGPLALLLGDIDGFKRINDDAGHAAGDTVLVGVARRLAASIGDDQMVARWGGEEFAVLAPVGAREALALAEGLRRAVAAGPIADRPVTISFGVTAVRDGDELQCVFARADRALLAAKRTGRDRCVLDGGGP